MRDMRNRKSGAYMAARSPFTTAYHVSRSFGSRAGTRRVHTLEQEQLEKVHVLGVDSWGDEVGAEGADTGLAAYLHSVVRT